MHRCKILLLAGLIADWIALLHEILHNCHKLWEMKLHTSAPHLAGVMEIFETGDVMFQKLRSNVRDSHVKDLATSVGLMCFPAGLEGPEPMVRGCLTEAVAESEPALSLRRTPSQACKS